MGALQLRCHTEWLGDNSQAVDQTRWTSYLVRRRNWVTRNAFLTFRAVRGVQRLDSLSTKRNVSTAQVLSIPVQSLPCI
jgi:hypothetical protein